EVSNQCTIKKKLIIMQFGSDPVIFQTLHLLFSMFPIHRATPFCREFYDLFKRKLCFLSPLLQSSYPIQDRHGTHTICREIGEDEFEGRVFWVCVNNR